MDDLIDGIVLTPLRTIDIPGGTILHGLRAGEPSYKGFGEAYFSSIDEGSSRDWKRHTKMTLNLVVPIGLITFTLFDERTSSPTRGRSNRFTLGPQVNYARLTVPPGVWMTFTGTGTGSSLLLNIADIEHDPSEAERLPLSDPRFPPTVAV